MRLDEFIILEGRSHGRYSYPDLLVSINKLGVKEAWSTLEALGLEQQITERAESHLDLQWARTYSHSRSLGNIGPVTLQNLGVHGYLGFLNWDEAVSVLAYRGEFMLTLRQYVDFLEAFTSKNMFDGNGNRISRERKIDILKGILVPNDFMLRANDYSRESQFRSEFLDLTYSQDGKLVYHTIDNNGQRGLNFEHIVDILKTEDRGDAAVIDIRDFLKFATNQGFPSSKTPYHGRGAAAVMSALYSQYNHNPSHFFYRGPRSLNPENETCVFNGSGLNSAFSRKFYYPHLGVRPVLLRQDFPHSL